MQNNVINYINSIWSIKNITYNMCFHFYLMDFTQFNYYYQEHLCIVRISYNVSSRFWQCYQNTRLPITIGIPISNYPNWMKSSNSNRKTYHGFGRVFGMNIVRPTLMGCALLMTWTYLSYRNSLNNFLLWLSELSRAFTKWK